MSESAEAPAIGSNPALGKLLKTLPVLIFFIGFAWRLVGIGWGLPNDLHNQSYHPDEQVIWAYSQQIEPTKLDFTPGFYNYGTLYLTVLRVASDVVAGYGGGPKQEDPQSVWRYMGACHLAGRLVSAASGALIGLFVFLILRRFTNEFGASTGALMTVFAPSLLVHSRYQTVDLLATALFAISLWFALRVLDDPNPVKCAAWSAAFAGLSAGTKYTGALALLPLFVALYIRWKSEATPPGLKSLWLGLGSFFAAFFLATPGALLESDKFLKDFKYEMLHTSTGHGLVFEGVSPGFLYHLGNLIQGLGPLGLILGVIGLVWAAVRKERWALVFLAFALPYYVLIGRAEVLFIRYTFPLVVVLAVGFGWLMGTAHERKGKYAFLATTGILGLGMALYIGAGFTVWMTSPDPRDRLARELKADAESVGIASDPWFYTPPLIPDSAIMRGNNELQMKEMQDSSPLLVRFTPANPNERFDWDKRLITDLNPQYIVLSNFELGPVVRLSATSGKYAQVDRFKEFQSALESGYDQVSPAPSGTTIRERYAGATLLVEDMAYSRPVYWIWKRKP